MSEFAEAVGLGYLQVDAHAQGAAQRVCRWRACCRKSGQPCLTAMVTGSTFALEVRTPSSFARSVSLDQFSGHPYLPNRGGSGGGDTVVVREVPLDRLEKALETARSIVASCDCEELRQALRRPQSPLAPASEDAHMFHGEMHITLDDGGSATAQAQVRMHLPDREYACWEAGLSHLFECMPKPIPLLALAWQPDWLGTHHRLEDRFQQLPDEIHESCQQAQGPYVLQPRFAAGVVALQEFGLEPWPTGQVLVTRPGFSHDGDQAVFWVTGPTLTETFQGLLRLKRHQDQWRVEDVSHDADWNPVEFEVDSEVWTRWHGWDRFPKDWKLLHLDYPQEEAPEFFEPAQRSRLYEELVQGKGPPDRQALEIIPTLHGSQLSLRHLLMLAQDRGEIFYDGQPSEVSQRLASLGHPVVHWGGCLWLGKLLAHLDDHFPCRRATQCWTVPVRKTVSAREQSALTLLQRIFQRAGCPPLQFALAELSGSFGFQLSGSPLCRLTSGLESFEQAGTLWLRDLHGMNHRDSPFRLLGELCQWGDPQGKWTNRLWNAAIVESAWSEPSE